MARTVREISRADKPYAACGVHGCHNGSDFELVEDDGVIDCKCTEHAIDAEWLTEEGEINDEMNE